MDRESFIDRISKAVASGRAYRVSVREDIDPKRGYVGHGDESKVTCFVREVNAVGGFAEAFNSKDKLVSRLNALLDEYQPESALIWQHSVCDSIELKTVLADRNIKEVSHETCKKLPLDDQKELFFKADIGITSCSYALAETGTLAVCSEPNQERVASLLPPVHIALVNEEQIIPDLFDMFPRIRENDQQIPSNVSLITGPSKTGDIELTLTTGVHGPGKLHVLVLEEKS